MLNATPLHLGLGLELRPSVDKEFYTLQFPSGFDSLTLAHGRRGIFPLAWLWKSMPARGIRVVGNLSEELGSCISGLLKFKLRSLSGFAGLSRYP